MAEDECIRSAVLCIELYIQVVSGVEDKLV